MPYAIKSPDGEWYHGECIVFETPEIAWSSVANGNSALLPAMQFAGYRCVEVTIVEAGAVCEWRFVNKDGMQYGWIGNCPNAALWYENPHGQNFAHCPHCGRLIVEAGAARTGEDKEAGDGRP